MSDSLTSNAPSLSVSGGPLDGRTLTLERTVEVVLGSGANCHLRLELGNVNSDHAYVMWDERGVLITDYGSSTGTYVNGEKIGEEHPLADGDRLFLGPPGSKESAKILVRIPEGALVEPDEGPSFESDSVPLVLGSGAEPDGASEELLVLEEPPEPEPVAPTRPQLPPAKTPPSAVIPPAARAATVPAAQPAETATAPVPPPAKVEDRPLTTPRVPEDKPPDTRRIPKPEYTSEIPSIAAPDRTREPLAVPPPSPTRPRARVAPPPRRLPNIPKAAVIAAIAVGVALVAWMAVRWMQKPPPVITSITPPRVEPGQTLSIEGSGFAAGAGKIVVRIADQTATATSATETQITVTVPALTVIAGAMDVPLTVEVRGVKSNALFFKACAPPKIAALEPDVAMPGDTVVVKGQNLKGDPMAVLVGQETVAAEELTPTSLRFRVPDLPREMKSVAINVRVGNETGKPFRLLLGRLPLLLEVKPARVESGERVVCQGRGFDPNPAGNSVFFGAIPALVIQASATELTVAAPALGTSSLASVPVTVSVAGKLSAGDATINLARRSAGSYVPRFYPAPVPEHPGHDHAFVSTELGPFLLLSGKDDAASTAERAERVASSLNALLESAASGRAQVLEQRDRPAPSVAVAGSANPLVTATSADTAGYGEAWDTGTRSSRRPSASELAAYWKALIEDYLALFINKQRPARILELSARGKVLADLYAEASRGGGSVSLGMVSPLSAGRARAFRELALLLPTPDQGDRGGAAVEGRWQGTMLEGDAGRKTIEVRLRFAGGRLEGTVSTRSGGVTVDIPIKEASYSKGTVRFAVPIGGALRYFVGTLKGDTMDGSINSSPDPGQAVGSFSVKYLQ